MPFYYPSMAIAVAGLALWLMLRLARASRGRSATRAAYFDAVLPLFDRVEKRLEPTGFPRMTGHRGALAYDLQALPDALTFRKLPALWVMISLPQPLPVRATLDIVMRPSGQEPFTRFTTLPHSLPAPVFLPAGAAVRSDDAARIPPEHLIADHADLFDDPAVKELLISPKGLRIVILAEEADRGRFLIFRDAEMGMTPLPPALLVHHLHRLAALQQSLLDWSKDAR